MELGLHFGQLLPMFGVTFLQSYCFVREAGDLISELFKMAYGISPFLVCQ